MELYLLGAFAWALYHLVATESDYLTWGGFTVVVLGILVLSLFWPAWVMVKAFRKLDS